MEQHGAVVLALVAGKRQSPGWPDRYVCHPAFHGWLEFKGENTRLRPLQRAVMERLNLRRPRTALVVRAPGRVEDHEGRLLDEFDGTGGSLLAALRRVTS